MLCKAVMKRLREEFQKNKSVTSEEEISKASGSNEKIRWPGIFFFLVAKGRVVVWHIHGHSIPPPIVSMVIGREGGVGEEVGTKTTITKVYN